jgi:hypothetical protein
MVAWKWWDRSMHYLFGADPQVFLDLLLGEGQVRYLAHLPEKVEGDYAIVDTLLKTEIIEESEILLVHLESETSYDSDIRERLLEYNQKIRKKYKYKQDILSGVFHLGMDTALKRSPLLWGTSLQPWSRILEFRYPVVEMKHLTPEDIRRWERSVLLPLLPLTEGGAKWEVVQDMLYDLGFGDRELLKIAFGMAMERMPEEDRKRLKKEYHMIYDELRADPLCREMLDDEREEGRQEGRQEGALQTAQQIAIRLVENRFPELEKFANIVISAMSDVERLQMLIIELSIASTPEHAKQLLFSLASDS